MTTTESPTTTTAVVPVMDPELAPIFASLAGIAPMGATLTLQGVADLRAMFASVLTDRTGLSRDGKLALTDVMVAGQAGGPEVTLSVFRPVGLAGPAACLYFMHGGGMVIGDRFTGIEELLDYALELGVVVVTAEYRLAPEHPDPAPIQDCYAGLLGLAAIADQFELDLGRVVVVGTSAGGGLAAGTTLMARDSGGPAITGQLLMCPMLDDRFITPSSTMLAEGAGVWDRDSNTTGWTALLGDRRGSEDVSPYAAPARASDLAGLPATFLDVGSVETFRDEVVHYADRIWRAGGNAELHVWPGGFHGFDLMAPDAALSRDAKGARLQWLRRLLGAH
jgi:acetyl esterase/lipase